MMQGGQSRSVAYIMASQVVTDVSRLAMEHTLACLKMPSVFRIKNASLVFELSSVSKCTSADAAVHLLKTESTQNPTNVAAMAHMHSESSSGWCSLNAGISTP